MKSVWLASSRTQRPTKINKSSRGPRSKLQCVCVSVCVCIDDVNTSDCVNKQRGKSTFFPHFFFLSFTRKFISSTRDIINNRIIKRKEESIKQGAYTLQNKNKKIKKKRFNTHARNKRSLMTCVESCDHMGINQKNSFQSPT